eukprot:Hpha_TRINITY_DN20868_c0_g1::TRINITY_DN20868_c0_g1_i1::g.85578::m.85578
MNDTSELKRAVWGAWRRFAESAHGSISGSRTPSSNRRITKAGFSVLVRESHLDTICCGTGVDGWEEALWCVLTTQEQSNLVSWNTLWHAVKTLAQNAGKSQVDRFPGKSQVDRFDTVHPRVPPSDHGHGDQHRQVQPP